MSSLLGSPPVDERHIRAAARRLYEIRLASRHPAYLLDHVRCVDNTTGETFQFQMLDPEAPWHWQREVIDEWINSAASIALKARQIGITWLAAGYALWTLLYVPGSKVLVVSINEPEAVKVVNRIWDMYLSLPKHLRQGVKVVKPTTRARPSKLIELEHPDGRISTVIGLPSTPNAGHGETAALVILDEFSRQEFAQETWKATLPTTQKEGGRVLVISTGNGRGSNFFFQLWTNAEEYGLKKRFLSWSKHPDRDELWYQTHATKMPSADRGEQYPRDPHEAFILTGRPYFDIDALMAYEAFVPEPLYRCDFEEHGSGARKRVSDHGMVRVYRAPEPDHTYAVGADVATGRGKDYSAAFVIDLSTMELVAEFHGKLDADMFAQQLHYLGKWYGGALLAVEVGGGFGEAVTIPLRDGRAGRPAYPRLYRHVLANRPDLPMSKPFGFPMNVKTRPLVISQLEQAIRDHSIPFLTRRLLDECQTFVNAETAPSPRAQDGCNDDAVMACAITLEMYRLRGTHPKMTKRRENLRQQRSDAQAETMYPWQPADTSKQDRWMDERYAKEGAA